MARPSKTTTTAKPAARPAAKPAAKRKPARAPAPADSRDGLSIAELARGILSKDIRPRTGDVRRLAEAALADGAKPSKDKKIKADGDKKKAKGKKKLAKIPGQRAKK